MKTVEMIVEASQRKVNIDNMQFGYMPGGATDAIFLVRQFQEMYSAKRRSCTLQFFTWRMLVTGYHRR